MIRKNVLKNDTVVSANCSFSRATTTMLIAVAMIAFMSIATKVNANPPHPPPDCAGTPFQPFIPGTFHTNPTGATGIISIDGCEFEYEYWWRFACDEWYDTYIGRITYISGDSAECANLFHTQYKTIMDAIKADIIVMQNPWGVPHALMMSYLCHLGRWSPPQWRFFRPSCLTVGLVWQWKPHPGGGGYTLVLEQMPCVDPTLDIGYCVAIYRYCIDVSYGYPILRLERTSTGTFGNVRCPNIITHNGREYRCIMGCDD